MEKKIRFIAYLHLNENIIYMVPEDAIMYTNTFIRMPHLDEPIVHNQKPPEDTL